ncbi:hypothetical protein [Roseovarius sp.]|uniref:hypothetical protein n=1 Tax=Roseovarius sp. TaxID=1486281 RepID=UPI003BAB152C
MARVVGDIAVEVSADIGPLQRGLRNARGDVSRFGTSAEQMAQRATRATLAMSGAIIAATAAGAALAHRVGEIGESLTNLSRVAGTTPEKFQEMAAATRSVGIEQEKLADILKDVQDRVGDFLATGGGPMADFFENIAPKVGVTAEQFARLSGPEALQLYVSSLEKANLTQSEMTFYMEAMASDLSLMLPLLRDNGREMDRLANEARDAGTILSNETVAGANELNGKLRDIRDEIRGELVPAMLSVEDEIIALADFVRDIGIPALQGLIQGAGWAAEKFEWLARAMASLKIGFNLNEGPSISIDGSSPEEPPEDGGNGPLQMDVPTPPGRAPVRPGGTSRRGGSSQGPTEDDFERLRDQFATEQEIIQENYERQLEQLEEFRSRKLATEDEFNQLEERIQKDHQEKMLQLEKARRAMILGEVAGAFGDLSALMQVENKKMFQIGKTAAIAEGLINGYSAALSAWDKGMEIGGMPTAIAFTAASLAKTGALISSIQGTSYGGGGGGAGAAAGGGAAAAGGAAQQTPAQSPRVALTLTGGDMYSRDQVVKLINQINEAQEDGAIIRLVG